MRVAVIAVGRLKQGPERELADRYFERFDEAGRKLGFRELSIHEIPESRARDAATRMTEEAAAISAHIPDKSILVAMDERGQNLESTVFARHLGRWRDEGAGHTIFMDQDIGRPRYPFGAIDNRDAEIKIQLNQRIGTAQLQAGPVKPYREHARGLAEWRVTRICPTGPASASC